MIVEFSGPAGVGKSTLLAGVLQELRRRGVASFGHDARGSRDVLGRNRSRLARKCDRLRAVLTEWRLALWCARRMVPRRGVHRMRLPRALWLCQSSAFVRSLRKRYGVHLVDEGPYKLAPVELAKSGYPPESLLDLLPCPDLVVVLTADSAIAKARIRLRGDSRTPDTAIDRWHAWHRNSATLLAPYVPVLAVDTSHDTDPTATVADRIVQRLFGAPDAGGTFSEDSALARRVR
jgi:thymidylate kinase